MERNSETIAGARTLDVDLYCMRCGYNLRGLSGDPIRCPECGTSNEIDLVSKASALVSGHIARIEGALNFGLFLMLIGLPIAALLGLAAAVFGHYWLAGVIAAFLIWGFVHAVSEYIMLTRGVSHRFAAAICYQLGALAWCVFVAAGVLWPVIAIGPGYRGRGYFFPALSASIPIVIVAIAFGATRYRRWIGNRLDPLKREVAVRVVAEFLHSRKRADYVKRTQKFGTASDDDAS